MWWCPSMMCLWEVTAASNWWVSVLVSRVGWLALLPYSFLLSTDLRKITGRWQRLIRVFVPFTCRCRVILLHLPPLIMQQLWRKENQWLSLQSTKQLLGALSFSSLLLHLSDLWKGKGGGALLAERFIYCLTSKSNVSLEASSSRQPTMCQVECKIHTDISEPVGSAFLS